MNLFKVTSIEPGIRAVCARNARVLVNLNYLPGRSIKVRTKLLVDIPSTRFLRTDPLREQKVAIWREHKKVLYGKWASWCLSDLPMTDALFDPTCPLQYSDFETMSRKVRFEYVVYRPPTWELHQTVVDKRYPPYDYMRVIAEAALARYGFDRDDPMKQAAVMSSQIEKDYAVAFNHSDLAVVTGASESQLYSTMRNLGRKGESRVPVRLMLPPTGEHAELFADTYAKLEALPEHIEGVRFIRPQWAFGMVIRAMARKGFVRTLDPIFVMDARVERLNWVRMIALSSVHRAEWFKMMHAVDHAPEIPT